MTKAEARAAAKARWNAFSPAELAQIGAQMAQRLFALPCWAQAGTVFCFVSTPAEPDTRPILRRALATGKRLVVPRARPGGAMELVVLASLARLAPGAYGIPEPVDGVVLPAAALGPHSLAVVPCLAASRSGVRLGRGGGYYDRFLGQYNGSKVLLCPQALLFDALPQDAWDAPFAPEEILTEHRKEQP